MPKVGEKHFAYNKAGYEKAKEHAKKTGQKIQYGFGGGIMNRKYYASGGAVYSPIKGGKKD